MAQQVAKAAAGQSRLFGTLLMINDADGKNIEDLKQQLSNLQTAENQQMEVLRELQTEFIASQSAREEVQHELEAKVGGGWPVMDFIVLITIRL